MKKTIALFTFALMLAACSPGTRVQVVPSGATAGPEVTTSKNNTIEGTVNGGGGKGVLCKKNGQETLEILDLYEGRTLYGLQYSKKFDSLEKALDGLKKDYLQYFAEPVDIAMTDVGETKTTLREMLMVKLDKEVSRTRNKIKFIEGSKNLKSTNDANEAVVDDDCTSKQIALYYDENILLVEKTLWNKLDHLNQAALIYHEVIYKKARVSGEKDSVQSRRIVSHLFSDKGLRFELNAPKDQVFVTYIPYREEGKPSINSFYIWEEIKDGVSQVQMVSFSQDIENVFKASKSGLRERITLKNTTLKEILKFETSAQNNEERIGFTDEFRKKIATAEVFTDTIVDPKVGYQFPADKDLIVLRLGTLENH